MSKHKISCVDCIHKEVCGILASAKKMEEELFINTKIPHNRMCDVCGHFLLSNNSILSYKQTESE